MKKQKLMLLLLIASLLAFVACSDDDIVEPVVPIPTVNLSFNLKLPESGSKISLTDPETGEVLVAVDESIKIKDLGSIVLVAHNAEDESFVYCEYIEDIRGLKQGVYSVTWANLSFPIGKYYFTLIASTGGVMDAKHLEILKKNYSEAAYKADNNYVFYKTLEMDLGAERVMEYMSLHEESSVINIKEEVSLERLSKGYFVCSITGWSKVPKNATIEVSGGITDLPSAFFIKSRKTLTSEEHKEYNISKFSNTITVTELQDKPLIFSYMMLSNEGLEDTPEEKGVFNFTFKENNVELNSASVGMKDNYDAQQSSHIYLGGLYDRGDMQFQKR